MTFRKLCGEGRCPRRHVGALGANADGSVSILFATVFLVLMGFVGLTVDTLRLHSINSELQSAADSAALSAATAAQALVAKDGVESASAVQNAKNTASRTAKKFFESNAHKHSIANSILKVDSTIENGKVSVSVTYSGALQTMFARLLGFDTFDYAGTASAVANLPPFVEVHILVDTSGSMAIGASASEQDFLRAQTGCAFACHDGAPVKGYADAYAYALANGVTLRYSAIHDGIETMLDEIDGMDKGHQFIKTAVYAFNTDFSVATALTSDTNTVRQSLPNAPAISGEIEGATHFNEIIAKAVKAVGPGGDGRTASTAVKLFIIATDGAQDPGRYWTSDVAARTQVDAFDMSFCAPMKKNGVHVGIIHTPYIEMPWDWGYMATLGQPSQNGGPGTRVDDIAPALQACAGNRYIVADDKKKIQTAFTTIFSTISGIYLTK